MQKCFKRAGAAGPDRPCLTVVLCLLAPGAGVRVRGRASTQAAQRQRALLVRDLNTAKEGICRGQQELLGSLVPARGGGEPWGWPSCCAGLYCHMLR